MKYSHTVLLAMALTIGSSAVYAQRMNFADIDDNADGFIDQIEFDQFLTDHKDNHGHN